MGQLFGISGKSNRDNAKKSHWGKNEFNSSFPAALLCYMDHINVDPVYITINGNLEIEQSKISVKRLFKMDPSSKNIFFAFEDPYVPYQKYIAGSLQRSDLVVMDLSDVSNPHRRGFEIKLTALPDNSTYKYEEDRYSCELVFRPPAIESLSLSIAHIFNSNRESLLKILAPVCAKIYNWRRREDVFSYIDEFIVILNNVGKLAQEFQEPFAIQPIWKTIGKKPVLSENCLDVFVWSNLAFTRLFIDSVQNMSRRKKFDRNIRSIVWVTRMLYDFAQDGRIRPSLTASEMAYELQNDKAFAISGKKSWKYLKSSELKIPRIKKEAIKEIILNGGQNMLSPERRFDSVIVNTPGLFD